MHWQERLYFGRSIQVILSERTSGLAEFDFAACGRGRDDPHGSPPAQIRTSASTHTALLKGEWRESKPRPRFASRTSSKRWDMHIPAQSQEHVRLNDVPLQLHPSLPSLRRKLPSLVRLVHRYYGAVRLLQHVHVRRTALGLHGPAFA
jgi:hypothetical protein